MDYIKGNLLTVMVSAIAVVMTAITGLPLLFAFLIWLSAFMLDASYTYMNKKYVKRYELNVLVRRSSSSGGSIELGFIKVAIIESAMIIGMGMVFESMTSDSGNGVYGSIGYSLSLILFASIHVMAFVRSYLFLSRINK